jgi:hypothetical protein
VAIFERIITVYNDKGSKQALKDINKLENSFAAAGKKIAKSFAVATAAAAALALKIGKDAVNAAMEDQKSQALLANALRNTIGANDAAIASAESYISALEKQFAIADDQLRPALSTLTTATGDLTSAQTLLGLALDVSAGSGVSLETITSALAKAANGNFAALSKLFPQLDKNAIKTGDLAAVTKQLADAYGGAAAKNANTFAGKLEGLKIAFGNVLEQVGYLLLPLLERFATFLTETVIPAIQQWISIHGEELSAVFEKAIGYVVGFFQVLYDVFSFVMNNTKVFKQLGAILIAAFAGAKVAAAATALYNAIKTIIVIMKLLRANALRAAAATALATGGASALAGAAAFAAALIGVNLAMNALDDDAEDTNLDLGFKEVGVTAADYTANLDKLSTNNKKVTATTVKQNEALAKKLALEKALAALLKLGIKPTTETDPIQLEAARLNLLKQASLEEARRVELLIQNFEAQMRLNQAAQRYADLLIVLSDTKISDEEVSLLAQKWNVTKGQVLEYIARIYAANTTAVDDSGVVNLLMKWGLTKEQAQKYVDFTRALKDEKLDDSEIEKLMGKWGMTRQAVVDYAKQITTGSALQTVLSPTYAQPGDAAAKSWKDALDALNTYLDALKKPQPLPDGRPTPVPVPLPVLPGGGKGGAEMLGTIAKLTKERLDAGSFTAVGIRLKEKIDELNDTIKATVPTPITPAAPLEINRERGAFQSTFDPSAFRSVDNQGMTVNVTVQGSVQSENDLAETIRSRLLKDQASGKPVLYLSGL